MRHEAHKCFCMRHEAHKCFLADGSDVFDKMFYQDGAPKETTDKVTVRVENIEEEIFNEVLTTRLSRIMVEKYNIKDMKEALLLRMKSQVVDEENFIASRQ